MIQIVYLHFLLEFSEPSQSSNHLSDVSRAHNRAEAEEGLAATELVVLASLCHPEALMI